MSLQAGHKLAHYEIVESIGQGGMGEVYRARDTKLGRDVAIKVLPDELARDQERLSRFEREARLLAQLNHANIATLHGLEEHDGQPFLVMELVEGDTLAERIAREPIPIEEATSMFVQIAEGLEAAHEKGIIHRDLKPANIKIAPDRKPKILDFGLAKAFAGDDTSMGDASQSPTLTKDTALGAILGTASYMSPEQARGKAVDARTDVWAFGVVLFEALTGKRPFDGETVTDVLAAVVKNEPEWARLPEGTPLGIRRVLRRCLSKDRHTRLQHIGDARLELEESKLREPSSQASPTPRTWWAAAAGFFLGAVAAGIALSGWMPEEPNVPTPVRRAEFRLPESDRLFTGSTVGRALVISPDGTRIVYVARRDGAAHQLFLREMGSTGVVNLQGTEEAIQPFFSPDSDWVGFFAQGKVRKISLASGIVHDVYEKGSGLPLGGAWGADGHIYFAQRRWTDGEIDPARTGIFRVSADGGDAEQVTTVDRAVELDHRWPALLPDGNGLLYTSYTGEATEPRIVLRSGEPAKTRILAKGSWPRYLPTGHVLCRGMGSLLAFPFDLARGEATGNPVPVIKDVFVGGPFANHFDVSSEGTLAYLPAMENVESDLVWVDRRGRSEPIADSRGHYVPHPRLSPDGKRVALTRGGLGAEPPGVWLYEIERGVFTRLTFADTSSLRPLWTPDGENIVLARGSAAFDIYVVSADGSGEERQLTRGSYRIPTSVAPDGSVVFFREMGNIWDIGMVLLDGTEEAEMLLNTVYNEHTPMISPDGKWLAYVTNEDGQEEVYVRPFPALEPKIRISTDGGTEPLWSRDGSELFYRNNRSVMSVSIVTEPEFLPGKPEKLFEGDYQMGDVQASPNTNYDVSADGRFIMLRPTEPVEADSHIEVVFNWFEELEELVPSNR